MVSGELSPLQYLYALRESIDEIQPEEILETDSDGESDQDFTPNPTVCTTKRGDHDISTLSALQHLPKL